MNSEPTNKHRARWAKEALAVFTARTFGGRRPSSMGRHDLESAVGDLIADLLHFAHQQKFDVGNLVQQACGNFGFELFVEEVPQ